MANLYKQLYDYGRYEVITYDNTKNLILLWIYDTQKNIYFRTPRKYKGWARKYSNMISFDYFITKDAREEILSINDWERFQDEVYNTYMISQYKMKNKIREKQKDLYINQ
jgi:hypothetical protein